MSSGDYQAVQPVKCVSFDVAFVQPECEFVNVAIQVLRAGVMVDAMQPTLHYSPDRLYAVRGDVPAHIFTRAMVDSLAVKEQPVQSVVGGGFVGVERRAGFDVGMDGAVQCRCINVRDMHSDGAPATLTHSEDGGLSHSATPFIQPFAGVFIPLLATDVGFVNLNDTAQGFDLLAASLAQPLQDEPRGLLRDTYLLGELQAADALARRDEQIHGIQPLVQRDVRPLEDRASSDGEILLALVAAVVTASPFRDTFTKPTDRAAATVRPEPRFKVSPRRLLVGKHGE